VYENTHRVSEDVTLCRIERHEQAYGEPSVSQSLQAKTEIIKSHVLLPKASILHVKRGREVRVLDPKRLVNKYLGTQDLDTTQIYSTYHEG
jgi:hypothetical protein